MPSRNEKRNEQFRAWRRRNPKYFLRHSAQRRAARKGLPFSLTLNDIPDIPEICPIALIPLHMREDGVQGPCENSPTLDRINPALGYVRDNVRVISFKANRWKSDMEKADIERLLDYVKGNI